MNGSIFLIHDNGNLVELTEQPYNSEELLQKFLASHPSLIAGNQIDSQSPRRWLLVSREIGVPGELEGANRWSLDHLMLDQDAIPTLIEVKRSSDTRIRREVVGQMLDYAANAVVYWSVETLQAQFAANCKLNNLEPDNVLSEFLQTETEPDTFWQQVKTNLQAGRVRLLFVADQIPPELRRIVEFLNEQMDPAEVLAVEIKQFVGEGLRTLVPRVIGNTEAAQQTKSAPKQAGKQWDEASFIQEISVRSGSEAQQIAKSILEWARAHSLRLWFGKGSSNVSFVPVLDFKGKVHQVFAVWTGGVIEMHFQWMANKPPFDNPELRQQLLEKLNTIAGVSIPTDGINRRPSFPIAVLINQNAMNQFLRICEWALDEIRAT